MDTYDFERIWGEIVMQRDDRKTQMLGMVTDFLRRQGLIQLIDYSAFYPADKQNRNINRYWTAIGGLPDATQQRAARQLADGFLNHSVGEYQQTFREVLDDREGMVDRRTQIEAHRRKIDRGSGDPVLWNERIAAEYLAALEVRRAADAHLDLDVIGVLGQGENEGISTVLREADLDFDSDVITLTPSGQSIKQVWRPAPQRTKFERNILDSITQVAQEAIGTEQNDWYLLGSRLAVPHFPEVFVESWSQPALNTDTSELATETRAILSRLTDRAEDNQPGHLQYTAEAIAEQHGISSQEKVSEISTELDRAVDLANAAPELRELSDTGQYESASIMAAASILMDPPSRLDEDDMYHRAWSMKQRHRSVTIPSHIIERFSNRGGIRRQENKHVTDWYHSVKRTRGMS